MTNPLQVSELVHYVKRELENDSLLQQVQVVGEVSNLNDTLPVTFILR